MKIRLLRALLIVGAGLLSHIGFSQEYNNFEVRYQNNLRGDLTFIGNHILNRDSGTAGEGPNDPYDNLRNNNSWSGANNDNSGFTNYNDYKQMQYIDVDSDPTTFSSSTSTFSFPQPDCNLIRYAGLYWSATYPSATANGSFDGFSYNANTVPVGQGRQTDFNQVKFRVPGGAYVDVTADEILYDGFTSTDNTVRQNSPYACYADVTALITALADPTGDYTVANVRATLGGLTPGGGSAAGWTLVIVYENPNLTGKLVSTFDGFARVNGTNSVDINYSGFETIPVGPVNASLGAGTLEGDFRIGGDGLSIEADSNTGFTALSNASNPANNFFNSNITLNGADLAGRTPGSLNTLGYDTDIFLLNNPANSVIPNGETGATFRFSTNGDQYYPFFNSFNVEVIEPNVVLEKRVEDIAGNDITGAGVNLGQLLDYVLTFQNVGNDDGTNYTIRDVLPINVNLDESTLTLPPGVTYVYDAPTRTITFSIPDNLIEENDPEYSIRMRVQVAENCFDFIDACTDLIQNLAYSTYQGVINTAVISDDPSVTDFDQCGYTVPGATNFLLDDLENCDFTRTVQLCGDTVLLDAGDNFDNYVWYLDNNGDRLIDAGDTVLQDGLSDTLLVDEVGTYIVDKQIADPCKGFQEIIIVELFGATQTNPITALINDTSNTVEGEIVVCPNDGEELPQVFLCGLNDTELIQVNIPDADSIDWEQLDEASCTAATPDCPNRDNSCTWNNVASGSDYLASAPGQYRMTINYQNGCFSRFYFNVFQNPLDPQYNSRDIICSAPGNITVTNMPVDYEYQLVDATNGNVLVAYTPNPSFDITSNGAYRVEMRQQGVSDGCVFVLDNIGILDRDFQVDVAPVDATCSGLGEIAISILNVEPQYYYEISQGGTTVDTFGPSNDNNYTFQNLSPGTYDVLATTDDGCSYTEQVTIQDLSNLDLTAQISQHITCREGNIQMDSSGGQTPHTYAIWSFVDESGTTQISYPTVNDIPPSEFQTSVIFDILVPGDYTFIVVDRNNCTAISNTVTIVLEPAVEYTASSSDETCFGANDGSITINLTDSNGYSVEYFLIDSAGVEIDSNNSGVFAGLAQGDYQVRVNQRQGNRECDFFEDFTISGPPDNVTGTAVLLQDYTCLQNGIIEAQGATGGTAPYEYSIDGVNFVSGVGAETFSNLTDGTYNITIRDANGCTFIAGPITIDPLNPPTDLSFSATQPICPALISDVTVSSIGGDTPIFFEIIAPAAIAATSTTGNTADFDGLGPGTYTFQVTDDKGCVYTEDYTIAPVTPINVVGQLVQNVTCFNDTDGEARFTVSGFNTTYDYSVTGPVTFSGVNETNTSIDLTGLDDGTYTIVVTDNETNCTATADVTINAPSAPLALAVAETQPTCTNDGGVVLTATGGWGGNSFEITYPDLTTTFTNSTGSFNNLNQTGTYTVSVTDANGCAVTETFVLNAAVAPVLQVTPNDFCYDDAVGLTLTATVTSGGDGNFEYSLNGGAFDANNVFTGLGPGTYTIDVRDGNDCVDSETITINTELTVAASAANITACGTDTAIDITAAGGDGNYVYAVVGDGVSPTPGDFAVTNPITVTGAGDYDVYVRDSSGGAGFCEASYDITVAQDAPVSLSVTNTAILCSGDSNATITISASGGEAPYTYSVDNGANYQPSNTFVNQSAGSYNIRIRDNNGCEASQTHTITEPLTLSASAAVTQLAECNPGLGAEVRITNVLGGTSPYEYSFDGGVNYGANTIDFLLPGSHTLFVRDANGCTFPMNVTVDPEPTPPNVSVTVDHECDGEGTLTITPDSTDFDYTYELDGTPNAPDTSNVFADVAPGNYTVTVNYTSNIPPSPSVLLLENFGTGPNTSIPEIDGDYYCYEPQNGSATACAPIDGRTTNSANSRINDLEYSVTNTIVAPSGGWVSPNDASGTPNGRYLVINVGDPGVNTIVYSKRNVEIVPNRDVEISLAAINLVGNGRGLIEPNILVELVDGGGTVIASGSTGPISENFGANDWRNLTIPLNPGANSTIDIVIRTMATGTNGNDVAIDNIRAIQTPEVCSGSVNVPVVVAAGNAFDASITAFDDISCNGLADGSITFEVENFDTSFEYQVNGGGFSAPQATSPIILNGLSAGTYNVDVRTTDNLGNTCAVSFSHVLSEPTALMVSNSPTQPTCVSDGSVIITASGGTGGYTYEIEQPDTTVLGPQSSNIFNNITQFGLHTITVTDANGCAQTDTFTTVAPSNPTANVDPSSNFCYSSSSAATIVIAATGGVAPYFYSINGGPQQGSNSFGGLIPGNYTFTVTDSFGCDDDVVLTIEPELTANLVLTKDIDCTASPDAVLTLTVNGGYTPYTYEININGGGYSSYTGGLPYTTMTAGTYQFRVTDDQGCVAESNIVTVTNPVNPQATAAITDPTCNGDSNGIVEINIDPNFGLAPYEYSFDGSPFSAQTVYPGLAAGSYSYIVRDANGCTFTNTATLTDPALFTANVTPYDVSCGGAGVGDVPGRIEIDIPGTSGGAPNFTYTLYDNLNNIVPTTGPNPIVNTPSTSIVFDGLAFGDYYVRIIDANGCEYYENPVRVLASPYLSVNSTITADCATGGTVELISSGGSGDYDFTIFGTATGPTTEIPGPGVNEETATFTALNTGQTYIFQVIDNVTGCSSFVEETIPALSAITVVPDPTVNDVTCNGDTDGSISFQIQDYDGTVTDINYEIRESLTNNPLGGAYSGTVVGPTGPGPTPLVTINNIPPGDYVLYFEEATSPFCSNVYDFRILEPNPVSLNLIDQNNGNCNEDANVTVLANGGDGTFTYAFVENGVAPVAGDYTVSNYAELDPAVNTDWDVHVLDGNGCPGPVLDVTISDDPEPVISGVVTNQCAADEGSFIIEITLDVTGIGPYDISVNGGSFQSTTLTNAGDTFQYTGLSSSSYTFTLRDANACGNTINLDILTPPSITAEVTTQPSCLGGDGEVLITAYGGSGVYMYELFDSGAVSVTGGPQASPAFTGLDPDTYTAFVYDQVLAGCDASIAIDLEVPQAVVFTTSATDVTCFGDSDGTITASLGPGMNNPPYTYQLFDSTGTVPQSGIQTTNIFTGLAANTYVVRVFSGRACQADVTETVGGPLAITNVNAAVVEFGCVAGNNPNNASITIDDSSITGGSGNYVIYEFINDQGTPATGDDVVVQTGSNNIYIETDVNGGSYIINVYDDNGCSGSTTAIIQPYDELLAATAAITNPLSCNPGMDGEITITATSTNNDLSRFEYSIDNGSNYQTSNVFSGLDAGTHNFLIRHIDTGCIITTSETLVNPNTFTIDVVVVNDVICFGAQTGQATFELLDATYSGPINWEVFDTNGTPSNTADDISVATGSFATSGPTAPVSLFAGDYLVEVTQANFPECSNVEAFNITGPPAAITAATQVTNITCVGNDGAIEIVNVAGGWGSYSYYVSTIANPDPNNPSNYVATPLFDNLGPGTYEIWVIDQNGCSEQLPDETLADPTPITASLQINQENCTNLQGEIEVVGVSGGQGANYTYQLILNGSPVGSPQTNPIFTGLGAGSYEVLVADQWSCTFTTPAELLYEEMNAVAMVVKPIDCTATPDGEITVTVTGGSTNLDYTVTFPDAVTTQNNSTGVFTGLTQAGTYTFVVQDLETNNPVCTETITQDLDAPTPVTFDTPTIVDVSCFGGSDGNVTINLMPQGPGVNDNPPYTYNLYDGGGALLVGPQSDPTFTGLSEGNYQIEAVSSRGCSDIMPIYVAEPTILVASASATTFACSVDNTVTTSTITATATDGTAPYLYSIDNINFQTANTFEITDAGVDQNITVYVEDNNGCTAVTSVLVPTINAFTLSAIQNTAITCANPEEVLLTVTDNGNVANTYTFELMPVGNPNGLITGTPTNVTATFELTAPGSYTFRATDDTTGCYQETTYTIAPYDLIDVVATPTDPVLCFGGSNGAMEINVSGYTGGYNYEVFTQAGASVLTGSGNTGTNPLAITGLSGGNYFVRVTQTANPLCVEDSNVITIASPDTALDATPAEGANVTCTNDQGEIIVSPLGGYSPYDIILTNTTTSQVYTMNDVVSHVFTSLSGGNYDVQITDDNGCVINRALVLTVPTAITADIDATPTTLACYGDTNATVTALNVIGGEGVYLYQLNTYDSTGTTIDFTSGAQSSPVFNNLGAGIYSITVSDGWSCDVETVQVTISEPTEVMASLIQVNPLTCTNQAEIELSASGGTAPYEYSTDGTSYSAMSGGDTHSFNVGAGIYQYYVRDAFGCEAMISNQVSVDAVPPLLIDIDDSAAIINCSGESSATIIANVTGGLGNYGYELYTDVALTNLYAGPQTSHTFSGLPAGNYYVRVTSQDCEASVAVAPIVDPIPLQIDRQEFTDVTCSGEEDGTITVEVSGGTGDILYAITPNLNQFDTVNTFTDLAPGVYDVIAQDENGCFISFQFTINQPSPVAIATVGVMHEVCEGSADGSIEIAISGGTAPYRTSLDSNGDSDFVPNQLLFENLAAGTHVIFVRDANNCEDNIIVEIEPGVNLNALVAPIYECTGNIPNNYLEVTLEDGSVTNDVLYALDSTDPADLQLAPDFTNIAPGDHYLTIAHSNGCVNTVDFNITGFEPLTLVLEQNNINEITAVATGGLEEYTFYFDGENNGSDNTYYINRTDTYTVTVVDQNGCEMSAEIFMEFIDIEIPNFFTPDGDGTRDFWIPDNLEGFPNVLIVIFDRYGRELYKMRYGNAGWDGRYHGTELPTGDYWYVIKLKGENDDREFVGHFTLYR